MQIHCQLGPITVEQGQELIFFASFTIRHGLCHQRLSGLVYPGFDPDLVCTVVICIMTWRYRSLRLERND